MRADCEAGMWPRSAEQGEASFPHHKGGRVQTAIGLLVFWELEHFTNVNIRNVVERDQRTGRVGAGGLQAWRPDEVCEAG